ncbi:hypothetical protein [Bhargavaea cecembensis]|uniref:hypothetical protein n=1 Tax=Bhargavaea cecembensis TaxID=394098 RepID=UPI00058D4115|nr:hypothetical protein [Bhargavaea cecembensis]
MGKIISGTGLMLIGSLLYIGSMISVSVIFANQADIVLIEQVINYIKRDMTGYYALSLIFFIIGIVLLIYGLVEDFRHARVRQNS